MKQARQGYRKFRCDDCGKEWEEATRDALSPSSSFCTECGICTHPIGFRTDPSLPVDRFGNLITKAKDGAE